MKYTEEQLNLLKENGIKRPDQGIGHLRGSDQAAPEGNRKSYRTCIRGVIFYASRRNAYQAHHAKLAGGGAVTDRIHDHGPGCHYGCLRASCQGGFLSPAIRHSL